MARDFKVRPTVNGVGVLLTGEGGTPTLYSASLDFTDGSLIKRFTITQAAVVSSANNIVGLIERPTITEQTDVGFVYVINVVSVTAGSFDVVVWVLDGSGDQGSAYPLPSETVVFNYMVF